MPIESQDLAKIAAQVLDVIAHSTNAELAEVRKVLSNLRGVELIPFGERLGRNRLHPGCIQLVEAPEVHGQAVGGEF
jgi:hypothetical protein